MLKRLQDYLGDLTITSYRFGYQALRMQMLIMRLRGVTSPWD